MAEAPLQQQDGWAEAPLLQQDGWAQAPQQQQADWAEAPLQQQDGWAEAPLQQQDGWAEAPLQQQADWAEAPLQQQADCDWAAPEKAAELAGGAEQPEAVSWAPSVSVHTVFWQSLVAAAVPRTIAEAERAYLAVVLSRASPEAHALAVQQAEAPMAASQRDDLDLSMCDDLLADSELLSLAAAL